MRHRLRVTRTDAARLGSETASITALHLRLDAVIRRHLPPINASLLAHPVMSGASVDWLSDLNGQPVPLSAVPEPQRGQAEALLAERLAALRELANRLDGGAEADLAAALRMAAAQPSPADVFVIGGQPVITFWGQSTAPSPAAAPAMTAATATPAAGLAADSVAMASQAETRGRRRWWPWLVGALLLALLLAVLFFLRGCEPEDTVVESLPAVEDPTAKDDLSALLAEEDELRKRALALQQELRDRLAECPIPAVQPPEQAEIPTTPAVQEPTPVPEPTVKPEPKPTQPPAKTEKPKAEAPKAQPPAPKPTKAACPKPRPKWEQPEVVLLLDASGSMAMSADADDRQVKALYSQAQQGNAAAINRLKGMMGAAKGNSRLDQAKSAVKTTVDTMPSDVDVGLVVFGRCQGADSHKFFSSANRPALYRVVDGISPMDGTPLARGLERAGNMMDGQTVPGTIVVLTDGTDSCGGDPCAVARAIHASKPTIKINVIDAGGTGTGACMAKATGGKVYSPADAKGMLEAVRKGTDQPTLPPECR